MKECDTCDKVFRHAEIRGYTYWTLMLHPNQRFLGRCLIALNRHEEDLLETTAEEKEELFMIMEQTRTALSKLFRPDRYNYSSLGNVIRHLHVHIIPRYRSSRKFENILFKDKTWGQPPWPNEEHPLRKADFEKLRKAILENLPDRD